MPLGAPIGTNRGLETKAMLNIILAQSNVPVIVDAGIGKPSHAAEALEIGADAVLVNTAIAVSADPIRIAHAFRQAVEAGSIYRSTDSTPVSDLAQASSPFTEFISSL
jgi:thiazole synthase